MNFSTIMFCFTILFSLLFISLSTTISAVETSSSTISDINSHVPEHLDIDPSTNPDLISQILKLFQPSEIKLFQKENEPVYVQPLTLERRVGNSWKIGKNEGDYHIATNTTRGTLNLTRLVEINLNNTFVITPQQLQQHVDWISRFGSLHALNRLFGGEYALVKMRKAIRGDVIKTHAFIENQQAARLMRAERIAQRRGRRIGRITRERQPSPVQTEQMGTTIVGGGIILPQGPPSFHSVYPRTQSQQPRQEMMQTFDN